MTGPTTRRGLMGAALAGVAVGGATPFLAQDHPDAALLALCTEFETAQRAYNGLWTWRLGSDADIRGPNYVVDDDDRERAAKPFDEQAWDISLRIDGMRVKARCLLLTNVGMRHLDIDDQGDGEHRDFGFCAMTSNLLGTLLQDLNTGTDAVTPSTCMDAPGIEVAS